MLGCQLGMHFAAHRHLSIELSVRCRWLGKHVTKVLYPLFSKHSHMRVGVTKLGSVFLHGNHRNYQQSNPLASYTDSAQRNHRCNDSRCPEHWEQVVLQSTMPTSIPEGKHGL
ncbi:unnamed protein product [Effrenium voratum]|nr:unnamed protein product [Effrenium voratum]